MNLDQRRLRAVIGVAEELSFSRAAKRLNITQPALSSQIRTLEQELGFALFDRSTRRVVPTEDGRRFVCEARRLIEENERLERFVRSVRRQSQTHLAVGTAIYTIDFPDRVRFLEGLVEACPDLTTEVVTGLNQTEIAGELAAGQLDLAILMGVPVAGPAYRRAVEERAGRESLIDGGLTSLVLRRRPVSLLVPRESPLAACATIDGAALDGMRVAMIHAYHGAQLCQPVADYLEAAGAELIVPPEPNAIGVERYGRQFRIPAVTLGWFPRPRDAAMVRRPLAGLDLDTELVLARHPDVSSASVERAWAFGRALFDLD